MKKCSECNGKMEELKSKTQEGINYNYYFKCNKCGEEIVDMKQLHKVSEKDITNWSVKLQKTSRKGRLQHLKKKGLV